MQCRSGAEAAEVIATVFKWTAVSPVRVLKTSPLKLTATAAIRRQIGRQSRDAARGIIATETIAARVAGDHLRDCQPPYQLSL